MAGLSGRHAAIDGVRHIAGTATLSGTEPENCAQVAAAVGPDEAEQGVAVEPQLSRLTSSGRRADPICAQSRAQAPNALSGIGLAMP